MFGATFNPVTLVTLLLFFGTLKDGRPYNFVQISPACGPSTYQIMCGET